MSKLSLQKREKIMSNVLSTLFSHYPKALFTAQISREEARDEEFIKSLLIELENKGLVKAIKKNSDGEIYIRRIRWSLTTQAYNAYKERT
jgi:hypothetical protein